MNRREFCRKLAAGGGSLAFSILIQACSRRPVTPIVTDPTISATSPSPSPSSTSTPPATATPLPPTNVPTASTTPNPTATPQPTLDANMATVALIKTTDRADGVRRALSLLDLNPARGNRVLLKPNLNSADPAPASTHPDVLRALLQELREMGARAVTIGERSGMGETRQVMAQTGVLDMAAEFGWETAVFDDLSPNDWVIRRDNDYHWSDGFAVPRMLLESDCVIQTCNLKTHRYGGHFTMSLKNSVGFAAKIARPGGPNYMTELHNSPHQRAMIAEINHIYTPGLVVIDGVDAFLDGGPAQGRQAQTGVILAGTDRIALDVVGVAILRLWGTTPTVSEGPIFAQAQIARAVELGLGVEAPNQIRLISDDDAGRAYAAQIQTVLLAGS